MGWATERGQYFGLLWKEGVWGKWVAAAWLLYGIFAAVRDEFFPDEPWHSRLMLGSLLPSISLPWWIAIAAVILAGWFFEAGYRQWQRSDVAVPFTGPDWPIRDALFALCPDIVDDLKADKWEAAGTRLLDLLSTGQIAAWGRPIGLLSQKRGPLSQLEQAYWQGATFSFWFLDQGNESQMHVESNTALTGSHQYADLRFNRAALTAAWNALGPL